MNVQQFSDLWSNYSVNVQSYQTSVRTLPDGERVELQNLFMRFKVPFPAQYSVRQAPQIIGVGLLEAIDESTILQLADPSDKDGDGVHGIQTGRSILKQDSVIWGALDGKLVKAVCVIKLHRR